MEEKKKPEDSADDQKRPSEDEVRDRLRADHPKCAEWEFYFYEAHDTGLICMPGYVQAVCDKLGDYYLIVATEVTEVISDIKTLMVKIEKGVQYAGKTIILAMLLNQNHGTYNNTIIKPFETIKEKVKFEKLLKEFNQPILDQGYSEQNQFPYEHENPSSSGFDIFYVSNSQFNTSSLVLTADHAHKISTFTDIYTPGNRIISGKWEDRSSFGQQNSSFNFGLGGGDPTNRIM